ncbi:MAG: zinc ribbon domain-containing protein [Ignavibacteriales bacterium]
MLRNRSTRMISRAIVVVLVVAAAAMASAVFMGGILSRKTRGEPYPVPGLPEDAIATIVAGRLDQLQGLIDDRLQSQPDVITFLVVDRTGGIIAGYPKRLVGENLQGFYIRRSVEPVGTPFPIALGGPGTFGTMVFQGHDPDDGRVSLYTAYAKDPRDRDYLVLSSWLRSAAFLDRTRGLRSGLDLADGVIRICFILFWLLLPYWVFRDARNKGSNAAAWGILTLFTNVVGWAVYVITRPKMIPCPACGAYQDASFKACTSCGNRLKPVCPQCGRQIEPGWAYCAECGARVE